MSKRTYLWICMTSAALFACGGDDPSSTVTASGVPGSKRLDELTADEAQKICIWNLTARLRPEPDEDDYCTLYALIGSDAAGDCEKLEQRCRESERLKAAQDEYDRYGEPEIEDECMPRDDPPSRSTPCTATVAELESCQAALRDRALAFTCADYTELTTQKYGELPAACGPMQDKCSDVIERLSYAPDDDEDEPGPPPACECDGKTYICGYECDGIEDCADGSDESSCS